MYFHQFLIPVFLATSSDVVLSFFVRPAIMRAGVSSVSSKSSLQMSTLAPPPTRNQTSYTEDKNYTDSSIFPMSSSVSLSQPSQLEDQQHTKKGGISMTLDELAIALGGKGRAQLVWDCYSIGIEPENLFGDVINLDYDDFETVTGKLIPSRRRGIYLGRETLDLLSKLYPGKEGGKVEGGVATLSYVSRSNDGTTKLLLKLSDGLQVETVIIPWNGKRSTLCISSQVGCQQGCKFCATGKMGKLRSLTSDEILAQMFFARKICRWNELPEVSNVVFMGMGEPADNHEEVIKATEILTTNELFQLSPAKVTVSTVGPTPDSFRQFAKAPCALAWSVHAVDDELRKKLVPTTKYKMTELRQGFIDTLLSRPTNFRTAMIEVVLIGDVNDSIEHANELAKFVRVITDTVPGCRLVVNLIPYNDIGQKTYQKPTKYSVDAFTKQLWSYGIFAHIRTTRGDDESAACGQLATEKKKISIKKNKLSAAADISRSSQ